jgi:hypothetical protein
MATMQAWVVDGKTASLQTVPKPVPGTDDALIKILIAGETPGKLGHTAMLAPKSQQ